ncbi:hypothetical protein OEZ85_006806 [Tetradesmus obliquus]|uniref:Tyrosine-protein kinase ephrin type A/B receptor-like domain-containing protein n=1 Tax=Tetradesmus obliquus TaxID=3088 RepID=A0ABY8TVR1_TETOB|nr:hypothetical protein OEZ85_006806 [Tetradesmus obliquus]
MVRGYVPVKGSDGKSVVQCVCPAGTYQVQSGSSRSCAPCPLGSFCPGGSPTARRPTDNLGGQARSCNANSSSIDGLTTKAERASKAADCVAKAGYVLPASRDQPAVECTGSSYSPAYNRLRACLPCQPGLAAPPTYSGPRTDRSDVCQVPPGKFWELNVVRNCPKGLYRPSWVRTDNKTGVACLSCLEGWTTAATATIPVGMCNVLLPGFKLAATTPGSEPAVDADESPDAAADSKVAASSASCYIKAGWGMSFDPTDFAKFKATKPCPENTYGVANETFGLINAPCKACTKNLKSPPGSTSFAACKNRAGFGYTSEGANQCPDGFWAAQDEMSPCEQCPPCRTTDYEPGNGSKQASIRHCKVQPGCGADTTSPSSNSTDVAPADKCPIGFYGPGDVPTANTTANPGCLRCPAGQSTSAPGSAACDVCAAGSGIQDSSDVVSACSACACGSYSTGQGKACIACPTTPFNHHVGDTYVSVAGGNATYCPGEMFQTITPCTRENKTGIICLPRTGLCSGTVNGPCARTGQCQCFATKGGANCKANNMYNWPSELDINQLGDGGGCAENLCKAMASKQGLSASCCPLPCASGRK